MGLFDSLLPKPYDRDTLIFGPPKRFPWIPSRPKRPLPDPIPQDPIPPIPDSSEIDEVLLKPLVERIAANIMSDVQFVPGCVVKCDLWAFEHTGIYVGKGKFVHRSGDGYIEKCDYEDFLNRLEGNNNALSIYVACKDSEVIAKDAIAKRALNALGKSRFAGYNLIFQNCHHFTQYCITGEEVETPFNCSFKSVEDLLKQEYGMTMWRVGTI